jgi:NAD(P)-dependent dehydrogenase (short-subunit alcohol dehydrogenase family)
MGRAGRVEGKVVLVTGGARGMGASHAQALVAEQPIPMRRGASPAEISTFVLFLVSDESAYATGAEFVVDGGLTSYVPAMLGETPYPH